MEAHKDGASYCQCASVLRITRDVTTRETARLARCLLYVDFHLQEKYTTKSCFLTFLPQQRYIYPFSVFQTTSTLLVPHILNLAWLRCGLDRQKSCPLLEKKWLFSVLFSLKITADLQNKLSGRVHVMTDNLLWNPKNVRDWSCFPFCNPAQCEIFVYVRIVSPF